MMNKMTDSVLRQIQRICELPREIYLGTASMLASKGTILPPKDAELEIEAGIRILSALGRTFLGGLELEDADLACIENRLGSICGNITMLAEQLETELRSGPQKKQELARLCLSYAYRYRYYLQFEIHGVVL